MTRRVAIFLTLLISLMAGISNGNVLRLAEERVVTNAYDRTYRLVTETAAETGGSTVTTTYDHDKANNRTEKIVAGGSNSGTWSFAHGTTADGNSNQVKSVTKGATVTSFVYDLNGNRTEKKVGGTTVQTYGFDRENRLTSLADSAKGTFAYSYDHRTRRVGRDETGVSGTEDEVSFAGGLSVQEYIGGSGTPTVEYVRGSDYGGGIGGVLYTIRGGSARSYNAYNSRGDVVSKTDQAGAITWQSSYEAFGTRTQEQGSTDDRQKANTKDEDPTGLLNEGMRYRDLEFGLFLTRDPAGFVDGPNVYTYVRQNPWTKWDPLGLAERVDPDGFAWSDRDHHIVPREVARDAGWTPEAKEVFNKSVIKTTGAGHNNTAHPKYNKEVAAEMAEFVAKWSPDGIGQVSAKDQVKMAQDFVNHLGKTKNEYIRGFNEVVGKGSGKVAEWYNKTGRNLVLKSTGEVANRGGRVINGMANLASKGSKMVKGVPFLGGAIAGGVALLGGADAAEATGEVIINSTVVGSIALDASGLRAVSKLQHRAIEFNNDPEAFLNDDTGNSMADDFNRGLNLRKRLTQEMDQ